MDDESTRKLSTSRVLVRLGPFRSFFAGGLNSGLIGHVYSTRMNVKQWVNSVHLRSGLSDREQEINMKY